MLQKRKSLFCFKAILWQKSRLSVACLTFFYYFCISNKKNAKERVT